MMQIGNSKRRENKSSFGNDFLDALYHRITVDRYCRWFYNGYGPIMDVHVWGILAEEFPQLYAYKTAVSFSNTLSEDKYGKCEGQININAARINTVWGKDALVELIITGILER